MPSRSELEQPNLKSAPSSPTGSPLETSSPRPPSPLQQREIFGLVVVLFILSHPLLWSVSIVPSWSPSAGIALLLVAWFGWRFALSAVAIGSLLLLLIRAALRLRGDEFSMAFGGWILVDGALTAAEACLAWWLYRHRAGGNTQLADPQSAMQFVLLVAGLSAVLLAVPRLLLLRTVGLINPANDLMAIQFIFLWLEHALGMLILGSPLLVILTPWFKRRGLLNPTQPNTTDRLPRAPRKPTNAKPSDPTLEVPIPRKQPSRAEDLAASRLETPLPGDWLEIIGLAACTSILSLILSQLHGRELMGWQLWGVQILLIVWASLRQGLRGGTVTAAASALLPLVARRFYPSPEEFVQQTLLQAHLVAQCAAGLLVSAASSWVRLHETGYRQVIAHVPIVVYSARFLRTASNSLSSNLPLVAKQGLAEVTLVSAASQQLFGCRAEELLGDYSSWLSHVHPEDQVVILAALEQLGRQSEPVVCEYRLSHKHSSLHGESIALDETNSIAQPWPNRSTRWLRDTLAPRWSIDGTLVGWEGVVTDITEQRYLADDLRRITSLFNALITNLPTGVFFVQGPNGIPILVNARARQLLGSREDSAASLELLPRIYRLHRPDGTPYPAEELPVYLALRQGRTTMRDDIVVHRADGRRVPLVTWAAPVHLSGRDSPDCAVWVLEDLTALHQAEAARMDSEGRLRAVIESMAEGLLVQDSKGVIVKSNQAASSFFNRPTESLQGCTLFELGWQFVYETGLPMSSHDHPTEVALRTGRPVRQFVLGTLPAKQASSDSDKASRKSFRGKWLLVNAVPIGQGVVTTFTDITATIQAREAIRASEERYRGLVNSLPIVLIQVDRAMRLTYANPALKTISGYDLSEINDPQVWLSVIHPDDQEQVLCMARAALEGKEVSHEFRYRAKDGSERVCFTINQPRYQNGILQGFISLMLDITRQRQLERELERSRRLELVGRLASGVAHDFNNVLSVVLNLADMAQQHLLGNHPVHEDLKRITHAAEQASMLASQLLTFSKQRRTLPCRLELVAVVRRTLELLRVTLPSSITLVENLSSEPLSIVADETQVQQVLMNLCLNARDAMPQGGVLQVSAFGHQEWIHLAVTDNGLGINPEIRDRIFEPFYTTKERGTGLGLAIVQQIIKSYGGVIEVQSNPGSGSRFEIRWPRA